MLARQREGVDAATLLLSVRDPTHSAKIAPCAREMPLARKWVGACPRDAACIRPAGHKGQCRFGDMAEEEFEVERVMD